MSGSPPLVILHMHGMHGESPAALRQAPQRLPQGLLTRKVSWPGVAVRDWFAKPATTQVVRGFESHARRYLEGEPCQVAGLAWKAMRGSRGRGVQVARLPPPIGETGMLPSANCEKAGTCACALPVSGRRCKACLMGVHCGSHDENCHDRC